MDRVSGVFLGSLRQIFVILRDLVSQLDVQLDEGDPQGFGVIISRGGVILVRISISGLLNVMFKRGDAQSSRVWAQRHVRRGWSVGLWELRSDFNEQLHNETLQRATLSDDDTPTVLEGRNQSELHFNHYRSLNYNNNMHRLRAAGVLMDNTADGAEMEVTGLDWLFIVWMQHFRFQHSKLWTESAEWFLDHCGSSHSTVLLMVLRCREIHNQRLINFWLLLF